MADTEYEERWWFDSNKRLAITITNRSSGSQVTSAVLTYQRLPSVVALERAIRGLCEREARKGTRTGSAIAGKGMRTPKRLNQGAPHVSASTPEHAREVERLVRRDTAGPNGKRLRGLDDSRHAVCPAVSSFQPGGRR